MYPSPETATLSSQLASRHCYTALVALSINIGYQELILLSGERLAALVSDFVRYTIFEVVPFKDVAIRIHLTFRATGVS